jgi:hydrogenase nickel incorporation protein HypA/HybF
VHEVGIAQNLLEQVEKRLTQVAEPINALRIHVSLGKLAGVSAEALKSGFEVVKKESRLPFAELEIEEVPIKLSCSHCQHQFEAERLEETCSVCGKGVLRAISGKELQVDSLEYE